jgi:ribosome recycling factor
MSGGGGTGRQMDEAVEAARRRLAPLRAGRATPELLDNIRVAAYGNETPLPQLAQVAVQPPRGLVVTPYDPSLVGAVDKAINDSDLGARGSSDGMRIRIEMPQPTAENRQQLARRAKEEAEAGRVSIRMIRRDAVNLLKRQRASDEISDAKLNGRSKDIQALTDEHVAAIDEFLSITLAAIEE